MELNLSYMKRFILLLSIPIMLASCVSSKKFNAMQQQAQQTQAKYDSLYAKSQKDLQSCRDEVVDIRQQKQAVQVQLDELSKQLPLVKENNTQ